MSVLFEAPHVWSFVTAAPRSWSRAALGPQALWVRSFSGSRVGTQWGLGCTGDKAGSRPCLLVPGVTVSCLGLCQAWCGGGGCVHTRE